MELQINKIVFMVTNTNNASVLSDIGQILMAYWQD